MEITLEKVKEEIESFDIARLADTAKFYSAKSKNKKHSKDVREESAKISKYAFKIHTNLQKQRTATKTKEEIETKAKLKKEKAELKKVIS